MKNCNIKAVRQTQWSKETIFASELWYEDECDGNTQYSNIWNVYLNTILALIYIPPLLKTTNVKLMVAPGGFCGACLYKM